jgi:hypothetical protein
MLVQNTSYENGMSTRLFAGYQLKVFLVSFTYIHINIIILILQKTSDHITVAAEHQEYKTLS